MEPSGGSVFPKGMVHLPHTVVVLKFLASKGLLRGL